MNGQISFSRNKGNKLTMEQPAGPMKHSHKDMILFFFIYFFAQLKLNANQQKIEKNLNENKAIWRESKHILNFQFISSNYIIYTNIPNRHE